MAENGQNDAGSAFFHRRERPSCGGSSNHLKLLSSLLRSMILHTMHCGIKQFPESSPEEEDQGNERPRPKPKNTGRSLRSELMKESETDKLSELLRLPEEEEELIIEEKNEKKKTMEDLEEFKRVVKGLQESSNDAVLMAARDVRRLTKDDSEARTMVGLMGAIPPLISLLDAKDVDSQIAALYALLNLSIANHGNKAAIVEAGAVQKMIKLIQQTNGSPDPAVEEAIVANFLGLSALDANKPIVGSSGAVPFLVKTLKELDEINHSQVKEDALRALCNLSISSSNVFRVLETDLVPFLISKLGDMEVSQRALSILSNIVSLPEGRKAISDVPDAFPILIDVLNWIDSSECQEKASYILMIMAHKSYRDRQAMLDAGIVSSLLELTLLGSALAQKRASRILECLRVVNGKRVAESCGEGLMPTLSAPVCGAPWSPSSDPIKELKVCQEVDNGMISEERKAIEQLVQQSLHNNMKMIEKRANLHDDFVNSDHFNTLTFTSTSKSLPF